MDQLHQVVHALTGFAIGEDERSIVSHKLGISIHNLEGSTDVGSQVGFVDDQDVRVFKDDIQGHIFWIDDSLGLAAELRGALETGPADAPPGWLPLAHDELIRDAVAALKKAHPYEEPAYEVWRLEDS